jgi:hypothetical protein
LQPLERAMNPGLDRRLWAAEDPADLWEAEVLFKTEDENRPVSPSKTSECSAHRLTLELTYSSGCGIKDGRIGASIPKRREEAPPVINRQVDRDAHQPRLLIRVDAKSRSVLPQAQKRFMTNLLSDVGIKDDKVDGADDELVEVAIERLKRPPVLCAFGHVISFSPNPYTTVVVASRFNQRSSSGFGRRACSDG